MKRGEGFMTKRAPETRRVFKKAVREYVNDIIPLPSQDIYVIEEPGTTEDARALLQAIRTEISRLRSIVIRAGKTPKRFRLYVIACKNINATEEDYLNAEVPEGTPMFHLALRKDRFTETKLDAIALMAADEE